VAKLTSKQRNSLKSSAFAEPGKRKYPIPDRNHAKAALSRVAQHGTEAEKATVRKKVHAKFPDIGGSRKGSKKKSGKKKISFRKA
jgi:hypothetical protein